MSTAPRAVGPLSALPEAGQTKEIIVVNSSLCDKAILLYEPVPLSSCTPLILTQRGRSRDRITTTTNARSLTHGRRHALSIAERLKSVDLSSYGQGQVVTEFRFRSSRHPVRHQQSTAWATGPSGLQVYETRRRNMSEPKRERSSTRDPSTDASGRVVHLGKDMHPARAALGTVESGHVVLNRCAEESGLVVWRACRCAWRTGSASKRVGDHPFFSTPPSGATPRNISSESCHRANTRMYGRCATTDVPTCLSHDRPPLHLEFLARMVPYHPATSPSEPMASPSDQAQSRDIIAALSTCKSPGDIVSVVRRHHQWWQSDDATHVVADLFAAAKHYNSEAFKLINTNLHNQESIETTARAARKRPGSRRMGRCARG